MSWTNARIPASSNTPTLAATGLSPSFTQGDASAVDLFSSVTAATNDSGQTFSGAVLTVTNVADTTEYLSIAGTDVALTNGASGTISGIGSYGVSVSSGTATVTLSGMTRDDTQMGTLIDGISYKDSAASVTAGNRVVTLTTVTDSGGSNNSATVNRQATVTVAVPANTAPTISDVANQTTNEGTATSAIAVTIGDTETAAASLTLASASGNTTLIPNGNIVISGSGANRTVTVTPAANQTGTTTITLTVTDGGGTTATDNVTVTVNDVDPTISNATLSVAENASNGTAVGTVSATGDTNGLAYAITAGNTGTAFAIDASTGAITVADSTQLNYENTSSYNLTVTVDDEDVDTTADSTATITVNLSDVNEAPANTKPATQTTNEDTPLVFSAGNNNALSVTDADAGTTLTTVVSVGAGTGTLAVTTGGGGTITGNSSNSVQIVGTVAQVQNALGSVTYTPTANASGSGYATLTIQSTDNGSGTLSDTDTVTINVTPIADTPSVTDTSTTPATQTSSGLVLARNAADSTEVTHFKITGITNGNLFKNDGTTAIANGTFITYAEGNAGLKFTPTGGGNGSFTAQAATSAANGGLGGSTVNAAIAVGAAVASPTVNEDIDSGAIAITKGGAETHYKITAIAGGTLYSDAGYTTPINNGDFIAQGSGGGNASTTNVYFRPTTNANSTTGGNGGFTVQASSAAADGGLTGSQIASTVTLTPVADTPSATNATTSEDTQTASGLVISRNAADGAETTHFKISAISGGTLYKSNGTTQINSGDFITFAEGNAGLKFTPTANSSSNGSFNVEASSNGTTVAGSAATATITVNTVADTPSVASPTINEDADSGAIAITRNAADGTEVTHYKITGISGGTLYSDAGFTTQITSGSFITCAGATTNVYFRPTANATTAGSFTAQASTSNADGGLGGATPSSTITITPVADTPSVTDTSTTPATQTSSGLVLARNAADSTEVTHFKITGITNGNLFKNDGTTAIANGTFITYAEGNAGLKFTPTGGGNGSFTAQAATSAADGGLGGSTVNAAIAVGAAVASPSIAEDTASTTIAISQGGAETHYKITAVTGGTLYSDAGLTTPITDGSFIACAGATTNVYFVPAANRNGTTGGNGSFVVQASSSAADGGLTGSQITSTVTLTPVADTPSVTDTTVPAGTQSSTGLVLSRNAADGAETTHFKITGVTDGTLYKNDGTTAIANGTFITYAEGSAGLKFTPSGTGNGSFTAQASSSAADGGLGGSTVTATATVTVPVIASAAYNSTTGVLTVTGSGFLALAGVTNDIVANKLTITGQGGTTYTLTDTANVEITSGTAFALTLSSTDKTGVNALVNKAGTASTDNTVYNLAAAEDWAAGAASAVNVADLTGNGITATLNQPPAITSNGGGATAAVSAAENATAVSTVTATDGDGDTPTFSISGGADQAKFSINTTSGALSFATAPDFETPTDSDANNTYAVEVTASDGNGGTDVQTITVTVTDVGEGGGGGTTTPATTTTTTTTTPPVTVDGATVSTTTVATATSSGTQTVSTQTVAPVTETRQEDSSTEHQTLADVPLATDSSGETLLRISLPLGVGLSSQTISGSGASTLRELLIAASDPKVEQATVFDQILSHGIDAYVPTVQDQQQVTVRTITFSDTATLPGQPIVITGAQGTGESNALHPLRQEALVVDTRDLPAGTVLTFDNVEFAIVVGAATLTGGNGRNFVIGDGANQHIVLGADDDELHGGAGNDYVGSKGGNDKLYGDEGDDTVSGGDGDDVLDGGIGVNFVHGGKDADTATFTAAASRYQVSYDHGQTVVRSLDDANDVDTFVNVETLRFADQSIDVTPYATDFSWIATLYRQVLGRQAELAGFQFWAQVAAEGQSHGDVALNFLRASENGIQFDALDAAAQIECLYTDLLGRPSELAGREYWMLQHTNGMSMTEIAWNFVHSIELTGQYLTPTGWDFLGTPSNA